MPSDNEYLKRIADERKRNWEAMKVIIDRCEKENRSPDAAETVEFDKHSAAMDELAARADRLKASEESDRATNEMLDRVVGKPTGAEPDATEAGLRAFLRGETRTFDAPAVRGNYGSRESRDLTKLTPAAGGVLVPVTMYGTLIEYAIESSGVLSAGPTILQTSGGEPIDVPYVTSYGVAALVAETAPIPESDPAFAKRTLGAYKYGQIVQVSRELVDDSLFDIVGFVAKTAGRNIGIAFGADLAVGNGSAKPSGVVQTATLGKTGGTTVAGAYTTEDLIDLQLSVIAPYRNSPSAGWLMKDATLGGVRKLKDGAGRFIFDPAVFGSVDTLLGKPVYTDPSIAGVGLSAKSVLFGDFSAYFVRLAGGARFERSDEFAFNTDLVSFKAVLRGDGLLVDQTGAIKFFQGGAT